MGRPHLKMRLPLAFVAVLGLATPLPRQALAANANITVAPDCSLQSLPDGTVNGSLFVKENGDLCTNASVTVGTVTVSNAFNLEATQLLVKADLDALAAAINASIPAGTATIGGTTAVASATGGATPSHAIVANNTTSVAIDASPGTLYSVQLFNNSATIAYLKLYDASQGSTTCGSGTPKKVLMIPASTSGAGVVIDVGGRAGVAFATAITRCVTTGIADNDTGAPAATTYLVEADYK